MAQFKVDYAQMQAAIAAEEKAMKALSQCADELSARAFSMATIGATIGELGYVGKVWNAYSSASNHQGYMYTLSQTLRQVHDTYMKCEKQVLADADDDISAKNGFSQKAVKKANNASKMYNDQFEKEQQNKKKTLQETVFDSTVGEWGRNYSQMGKILDEWKDYRANAGKTFLETGYGQLENAGFPAPVIGLLRLGEKKLGSIYENYEKVFNGAVHITDPDAVMKGAVGFYSIIDPEKTSVFTKPMKTFGKLWDKTGDVLGSDHFVERGIEILNQFEECVRNGDVGGAAATIGSGIVETGKASMDVGVRWTQSYIDKEILGKTSWVTGDILTVDTINEAIAEQVGVNPGNVFQELGSGIGDGVSGFMDDIYEWYQGR